MRTDRIYIARDGKSGMHVLVRILAVGDIGADCLPIDPDGFNELMMARDARSLVLAAQGLGPMLASEGDLASRIFVPSELQRGIAGEMDLVPSDLGGLLSECYFDPYAEPVGTGGMGYRGIGRTGKKAARDLIEGFDFSNAGDLSYLDSQFRAVVEPLRDWVFARNLLSIVLRIGGLYRTGADPKTILEAARFRKVEPSGQKDRFDMGLAACFAIPVVQPVLPHRYPGDFRRAPRYTKGVAPLRRPSRHRKTVDAARHRSSPERRGERVHQVSHLARDEAARRYRPQRPPGRGQMVLSGRKLGYRRQARERSDADSESTATGI